MAEEHTYPSRYPKDSAIPEVREAWKMLDMVTPGIIPPDVRAFLAGIIAGALMRKK